MTIATRELRRQARRWLKYRLRSRALILMYHRVTELPNDPYLLAVRPDHFAEQMQGIRKHCIPMRLKELVEALRERKVPNRAVVVTFDDGYADNLHEAKAVLEHYEVPATVFVTAGQVGSGREFWWDELDRLLLQAGTLPARLQLSVNGNAYEWELGEASTYTEEDCQRYRDWHIEREDDPSPRHRLFRTLYARLSGLSGSERETVLDELLAWAGAERTDRRSHCALTAEELILLQAGGLVDVGAHTMTHPYLAALTGAEQNCEIRQSKECLEAILGRPVTSFAYPHGSSTPESVSILNEAGFVCACSSHPDAVWREANCFYLPRVVVRDWSYIPFKRWLRWWIDG
jgi:peptidoglycan/xylan/chitin deacetylase (PgdA/CDA1 family)